MTREGAWTTNCWHSAFDEAKPLYRMIGEETTVEEIRELIVVPATVEAVLRAFVSVNPMTESGLKRL